MKKLIILLLFVIPVISFAQEKVTWDYPVKPGSEEWKSQIKSNQDWLEICQIPSDIITKLPTEKLAKIVLEYPFLSDISTFKQLQNGFNILRKQFNGLNELLSRPNGAKEIIAVYNTLNPAKNEQEWGNIEKGKWMYFIFNIEVLLSQNELLSQLSVNELEELLQECNNKYNKKIKNGYSFYSSHSSLLLAGRVMDKMEHPDFKIAKASNENIDRFLQTGMFYDKETVQTIQKIISTL